MGTTDIQADWAGSMRMGRYVNTTIFITAADYVHLSPRVDIGLEHQSREPTPVSQKAVVRQSRVLVQLSFGWA